MIMMRKKVLLVLLVSIFLVTFALVATCAVDNSRPMRMTVDRLAGVDPAAVTGYTSTYLCCNIYDSLIMYDFDGKVVPLLAESWEISDDFLSYTFKLKKGVKFHDGSELTASDVVFSLNRIVTMATGYSYLFTGSVKKAEAIDDYTVRFDLVRPYGAFIDSLCRLYIVNEKLIMANLNMNHNIYKYGEVYGDYGRGLLMDSDAGSGPYTISEVSPQNYVVADQFKDYHIPFSENAPTFIKFIANTEAITVRTMLAKRELEISDNTQSPESLEAISKIDGITITQYGASATQSIDFNNGIAPTDDKYFRKALAYLIDYDGIMNIAYPGSVRAIGPINAATPGAGTQHSINPYNYDLEKAKECLALSKYANQLDKYPVEFLSVSGLASHLKTALSLQATAKQAGITVKITEVPFMAAVDRYSKTNSSPNMITLSHCPYYYDAGGLLNASYAITSQGTTANPFWIPDNVFAQMISDSLAIQDIKERYAAYAKIEAYILDECYGGFIADLIEKVAYQSEYVYWPVAEYFSKTGKPKSNCLGYHYWFHDFEVYPEKIPK